MEVLLTKNNHLNRSNIKYGCVCNKCGTVFIFKKSEASVPRCIDARPEHCTIICPNCRYIMTLNQCEQFRSSRQELDFREKYYMQVQEAGIISQQ